jgi:hypothetical protein
LVFALGWFFVAAKPNVPLVRLPLNYFQKKRVGKNKKYGA